MKLHGICNVSVLWTEPVPFVGSFVVDSLLYFIWASGAISLLFYWKTLETVYHVFREKLYIILNTLITKGYKILEGDGTEGKMDGIIIKLRVKLALYFLELYPTLSSNFLMAKVKKEKYVTRWITSFRGKQTYCLGVTWFLLALRPESNVSLGSPSGDPMGCGGQCP